MPHQDTASQLALIDHSSDRKYFTIIPNLVLELPELTVYDIALYAIIKRIAGERGECFMTTRRLATEAKMSVGRVSKSKHALVQAGLIRIIRKKRSVKGHAVDHIIIVDIWQRNAEYFSKCSSGEQKRSPGEQKRSPGETEEEQMNKNNNNKNSAVVLSQPQKDALQALLDLGVDSKIAERLVSDTIAPARILTVVAAAKANATIRDKAAWVVAALQGDWDVTDRNTDALREEAKRCHRDTVGPDCPYRNVPGWPFAKCQFCPRKEDT